MTRIKRQDVENTLGRHDVAKQADMSGPIQLMN